MKVLQRYFASEIIRSVFFVLAACLALFAFFDLMGELKSIGHGNYKVQHAFLYVLMGLPGDVYELMPIAALIGTIWTLAQFASRSEFTIMRVSSMSTWFAFRMLIKIGLVFVVITFVFGEFVSPAMSGMAKKMKLQAQGSSVSQQFRSGLWAKDVIKENGITGKPVGTRFFNVHDVTPSGELNGVRLYEFDSDFRRLRSVIADAHKKRDRSRGPLRRDHDLLGVRSERDIRDKLKRIGVDAGCCGFHRLDRLRECE